MTALLENASQPPKFFYCRHMQPGICRYEDETVLVDTDALKKMIATGNGIPVYVHHQPVELDKLQETAGGYVVESFYNELDGWAWFKCIAVGDECHTAIAKGWSVSNAYKPNEFGHAGTKNNCPYNREILGGQFTHLAIVPNPRYEEACIMSPDEFKAYQETKKRQLDELHNSKPAKGPKMFKLFKNEKKEVTTVDLDTMIELESGSSLTVREMLNAVKKNDEDAEEAKKKKEEEDKKNGTANQVVEVDGEQMPLKELVNKYCEMKNKKTKKNESEEDAEEEKRKKEEKEKQDKKNADEEEAKKKAKDEEDKKNSGFFEELKNAHNKAIDAVPTISTPASGTARGAKRYGSAGK